jgi:hypothetical protein
MGPPSIAPKQFEGPLAQKKKEKKNPQIVIVHHQGIQGVPIFWSLLVSCPYVRFFFLLEQRWHNFLLGFVWLIPKKEKRET